MPNVERSPQARRDQLTALILNQIAPRRTFRPQEVALGYPGAVSYEEDLPMRVSTKSTFVQVPDRTPEEGIAPRDLIGLIFVGIVVLVMMLAFRKIFPKER